jgi:hypothetical protein
MGNKIKILKQRYKGIYVEDSIGFVYLIMDIYTYEGCYYLQTMWLQTKREGIIHIDKKWEEVCKEMETYFDIKNPKSTLSPAP